MWVFKVQPLAWTSVWKEYESSILQIPPLPCFGRWGASQCKHSSREQVSQEENLFDIIFCEVAHIPRLIPPACCVYFQISRDGADSCSTALESWWRSPCHKRHLLLGCVRFVCTLKWWNRPEIYFLPGFDLIFSDIWALICSGLGCFRYKLDIMDFRACVLWLCVTVEGYAEQTQSLRREGGPHVSGSCIGSASCLQMKRTSSSQVCASHIIQTPTIPLQLRSMR